MAAVSEMESTILEYQHTDIRISGVPLIPPSVHLPPHTLHHSGTAPFLPPPIFVDLNCIGISKPRGREQTQNKETTARRKSTGTGA